ncbi:MULTISPECIES: histone deacetylase family protein [Mycobacterium avium complex (MAC)]|jgi:acetoin utilization deacetylase AcuC-like enzyme|uniref:Acetoin utilization protein n=1 Tax=Mycobacterium bouchedurhonense TaxID=701041 RepID=A0AAW5S0I1_MYCBC|nr:MULTISPECIES: histone deacetylase family protein [Mycobacterium avium complex (MAC)]ETB08401.1 acetoin utilization protein [Mycobacterium avium subsp. silvaticum ATCC 49884]ETB15716.1 acetoin utilization protein [Mycobacterium avium subsp. avium 10-9275]ETB20005.1 acetoin utilization protein [Mycobacterium avium subsp. avium 11-4751]ETB44861.1 acetoin utilization protein [Mycobacterium avium 11-0986]ANR92900.1 acetoin utilization protein [Mycobacterium avium]
MATLLLHHPDFAAHRTAPGHPERPDRYRAVAAALSRPGFDALVRETAEPAELAATRYVHSNRYVDALEAARPQHGYVYLDGGDTMMEPSTWETALRGVGATLQAVDRVLAGDVQNAFVACRPPGHHAETERAMGFCLFNNISIGARHAQRKHGLMRVAIVDFDVHHGNGTQQIFYSDPSVLYASTHQMPLFPGTGAAAETGVGNIFNSPLAPGDGGAELRAAFTDRIVPALQAFSPELIIVSAGFDAHERDPLGSLTMTTDDFGWVTRELMKSAEKLCDGRLVAVLEGGYDLQALADSVTAHVGELLKG